MSHRSLQDLIRIRNLRIFAVCAPLGPNRYRNQLAWRSPYSHDCSPANSTSKSPLQMLSLRARSLGRFEATSVVLRQRLYRYRGAIHCPFLARQPSAFDMTGRSHRKESRRGFRRPAVIHKTYFLYSQLKLGNISFALILIT